MKNKYLLGVDGGNSKTDYLLFDLNGDFIDGLRAGTCSHEALRNGYQDAHQEMNRQITTLLTRNHLAVEDIDAAVFGLAGADLPNQKAQLELIVTEIGFKRFIVENDGFLGIKAASLVGYGVCSINGTGTVNVGIDQNQGRIQIGGVGYISGDESGGSFLVRRTFQAVFDQLYRFGTTTTLTDQIFSDYQISSKDKYLETIIKLSSQRTFERRYIIQMLFKHANNGDQVAIGILEQAGINMGLSVAGCIKELNFEGIVPIVLAGSIWANALAPHMFDAFKSTIETYIDNQCEYHILKAAPASGAILWAYELATNQLPQLELRKKVLSLVEEYQVKQPTTR